MEKALEHKIIMNHPIQRWDEALPLGNGLLGSLVWGNGNPLIISLDRGDLWDTRVAKQTLAKDYTYAELIALVQAKNEKEIANRFDESSKETKEFSARTVYAWFFFFTILFSGGLIPWYITIRELHLLDTIWALVLPGAVPVFNCILLLNFFRQLPKELSESAYVDGANQWTIMWRIYVPLSAPALATILLFAAVGHWNSWFDGLILMNKQDHYPLQTYLQTRVVAISQDPNAISRLSEAELKVLSSVNDRTTKAAQIFVAAFPILCIYPFLQRYFVKGIVVGSVKG